MSATAPCAAGCTLPRRHTPACADPDTCAGCLPALAADGLLVCARCHERVLTALSLKDGLAAVWVDVEDAMTLKGRHSGARGRSVALPLDLDAADWRTAVRACLVGWMLILEEDFGAVIDRKAIA